MYYVTSFYIITEYINLPPPPNNTYKGLIMFISLICHTFFHHITSLQKDLNLPPPPNNTYKGFPMIMAYSILWKIQVSAQVVQEGRFLRENLGSGRTKNLRQEPFHDFVGVCWKLGSFYPKKHRLRANVRICAEQSLGGWSSSWLWKCGIPYTPRECWVVFSGRPWRLGDVFPLFSPRPLGFPILSSTFSAQHRARKPAVEPLTPEASQLGLLVQQQLGQHTAPWPSTLHIKRKQVFTYPFTYVYWRYIYI